MVASLVTVFASLVALLAAPPLSATARAAEPEKVIFLHYWTGPMAGGVDAMVAAFNTAHPEYQVKAAGFEHESFKIGVKVMLAAGNPPDLFSYWAGARTRELVTAGTLAPIDDLWREAGLDKRFSPAVAAACRYDGAAYAVPVTQHYVGFFYNKKIFRELGLSLPATFEEFKVLRDKLKQAGTVPAALGSRDKWPAQFWFDYLLLRTAGPQYRDRLMRGEASYLDPEVRKVMELWAELIRDGTFNETPNVHDWSEAAKMVSNGKAAMTLMGTWIIGLFEGQLGFHQDVDYGFFSFPVLDPAVTQTALGPIDVLALPKDGNLKAARQVLASFTEVGPQEEMSRGSGALAPNLEVPKTFYSPLQRQLLTEIAACPEWAFNYDLATPPPVAEAGLDMLAKSIDAPDRIEPLLRDLQVKVSALFAEGAGAR